MSGSNIDTVLAALDAMNHRDIDRYLSYCTADVELRPPTAPIEGSYRGRDGVRRFIADVEDSAPDFHLDAEKIEAVSPDRVIASIRATATGRSSRVPAEQHVTNVYDLADGRIERVRVFLDHAEALKAVGLRR